jgi:hypothetical protein
MDFSSPASASPVMWGSSMARTSAVAWNCSEDGGPTGRRRTGTQMPTWPLAATLRALRLERSVLT